MPQIKTVSLSLAVLSSLAVLALSGCGDVNSQANLDTATGKHVAGWLLDGHNTAARADLNGCTDCHGSDLTGGISKVSCLQCHTTGTTSVHPTGWGSLAYALHPDYVGTNGTATCATAICHGTALTGVTSSGPPCTNCHMAGTALAPQTHAWVATTTAGQIAGHVNYFDTTPGTDFTTCRNAACHGATLQGAFASGPSCIGNGCHGSGNPLPAEN